MDARTGRGAVGEERQGAAALGIGVGGSLDVISGTVKRAPVFFQRMRLEWLYRLLTDFSRWKRIMVLPKFMRLVKKQCRS